MTRADVLKKITVHNLMLEASPANHGYCITAEELEALKDDNGHGEFPSPKCPYILEETEAGNLLVVRT